eukprot:1139279-Pelagomonas_calceolata.AAC.5
MKQPGTYRAQQPEAQGLAARSQGLSNQRPKQCRKTKSLCCDWDEDTERRRELRMYSRHAHHLRRSTNAPPSVASGEIACENETG